MRFAFAGIDFLGDVFEALIAKGWEPVKLFSRPCDSVYDSTT
jgi:methionyl-tRNA formyltransferase